MFKIALFVLAISHILHAQSSAEAVMRIHFTGLDSKQAPIFVELLDKSGNAIRKEIKTLENGQVELKSVLPGVYALRIFQDLNGNGKLDTGWMGIPSEPYGFSNNAMGRFGPPSLADQLFYFDGKTPVDIALR